MDGERPDEAAITAWLERWAEGDRRALDRLIPALYGELRRLARGLIAGAGTATLPPTALVHELWIKLSQGRPSAARDRAHFLRIAARAMRQVLVDLVRERRATKRGGGVEHETLDAALSLELPEGPDLLALDQALTRLCEEDELAAQVVELRCFAGLTIEETAAVQGRHPSAVNRDFAFACAYLKAMLSAP
jgi:RNA polymerase sigma factor (TIGR02999 family)